MKSRVLATIQKYDLLAAHDAVLVGLSGGSDSVGLLHCLWSLRRKIPLTLYAVYINHQIRPAAARKEEQFCRKLCEKLHIPFQVVSEDVPALSKKHKIGLEEAGRNVRYGVFEALRVRLKCQKIAVAHHQDDRVETMLFRFLRGTGPTGLVGIPVKRGKIIRPLFEVSKSDILAYLKRYNLSFCRDSSNTDERFRRNYIRHTLLPEIRTTLNPAVDGALLRLSDILEAEERYLDAIVKKQAVRLVSKTAGGKIQLALSGYPRYDLWLRRRLLRYCLEQMSGQGAGVEWETVERLDQFCLTASSRPIMLPGTVRATRLGNSLLLDHSQPVRFARTLPGLGQYLLPELSAKVVAQQQKWTAKSSIPKDSYRSVMDAASLTLPLVVRTVNIGDRFQPLGLRGTKKVGDFLTDKKVPKVMRDEIPVVCDQRGIVWLPGFTIAERVKVTTQTTQVVRMIYGNDTKRTTAASL